MFQKDSRHTAINTSILAEFIPKLYKMHGQVDAPDEFHYMKEKSNLEGRRNCLGHLKHYNLYELCRIASLNEFQLFKLRENDIIKLYNMFGEKTW